MRGRHRKKKKRVHEDEPTDWEFEEWRQYLLQIGKPIIPFDVPVPDFPYVCHASGAMDPDRYPDLNYVEGEIYHVRKSRWSNVLVEIRGPFYKKNQDRTHVFKSFIVVRKENCKQHLKRIDQ